MGERISYLEKLLNDSADKHAMELQNLKDAHNKHASGHSKVSKDLDALKSAHEKHATTAERLSYIERMLGDSADRHAREIE
eukprot:CAMPEP_0195079374 /NCGR_PEP_ID=MMETSP0448-20130528/21306_1 /TAXON_ID=66468 /ORGANISM="Heterocapsa triquestra, Strain CCMP 448" /LENGTH=80 /DNA_ID=CAMNT_0040112201 /DNA_START=18 /DNA_END=257 /DNA_ORIENTATION=+